MEPAWASDNELVYTSTTSDSLMSARLQFDPAGNVTVERSPLFDRSRYTPGSESFREYDVSRDGQHFLFARPRSGTTPQEPIVVLNWTAEVRRALAERQTPK